MTSSAGLSCIGRLNLCTDKLDSSEGSKDFFISEEVEWIQIAPDRASKQSWILRKN